MEAIADTHFNRQKLNRMAETLLKFFGSLESAWETRINILRDDKGLDALQTIGSLCAKVLDAGEHTITPSHPFFDPNYTPVEAVLTCPICGEHYEAAYPGQPACGKPACANARVTLRK